MNKKYENFKFFNIDELNKEMKEKYRCYQVINITKANNEVDGDYFIAWIVKK